MQASVHAGVYVNFKIGPPSCLHVAGINERKERVSVIPKVYVWHKLSCGSIPTITVRPEPNVPA